MRLYVVHQSDGQILAAAVAPGEGTDALEARPYPISPDHFAAEVDVPEEHAQMAFDELCVRFNVDPAARCLVLRDRPDAVT
jgi:hypothetical protein